MSDGPLPPWGMAVLRILAGRARLHKLPYYVAIPAGALSGAIIGYAASMPTAGPRRIALMVGAFLAVVVLGLVAPQPARKPAEQLDPASPADAQATGSGAPGEAPPEASNDSLCD